MLGVHLHLQEYRFHLRNPSRCLWIALRRNTTKQTRISTWLLMACDKDYRVGAVPEYITTKGGWQVIIAHGVVSIRQPLYVTHVPPLSRTYKSWHDIEQFSFRSNILRILYIIIYLWNVHAWMAWLCPTVKLPIVYIQKCILYSAATFAWEKNTKRIQLPAYLY